MRILRVLGGTAGVPLNPSPITPSRDVSQKTVFGGTVLSGLGQDAFMREGGPAGMVAHKPIIPSLDETMGQWQSQTGQSWENKLQQWLKRGSPEDLRQAAGLLNAGAKTQRIQYAPEEGARSRFRSSLNGAVNALRDYDYPAARIYLQRTSRMVTGFRDTPSEEDDVSSSS